MIFWPISRVNVQKINFFSRSCGDFIFGEVVALHGQIRFSKKNFRKNHLKKFQRPLKCSKNLLFERIGLRIRGQSCSKRLGILIILSQKNLVMVLLIDQESPGGPLPFCWKTRDLLEEFHILKFSHLNDQFKRIKIIKIM